MNHLLWFSFRTIYFPFFYIHDSSIISQLRDRILFTFYMTYWKWVNLTTVYLPRTTVHFSKRTCTFSQRQYSSSQEPYFLRGGHILSGQNRWHGTTGYEVRPSTGYSFFSLERHDLERVREKFGWTRAQVDTRYEIFQKHEVVPVRGRTGTKSSCGGLLSDNILKCILNVIRLACDSYISQYV